MIRKSVSMALPILLVIGLVKCATDLGAGTIKELEDNEESIRQNLGELWDAFLEEANG